MTHSKLFIVMLTGLCSIMLSPSAAQANPLPPGVVENLDKIYGEWEDLYAKVHTDETGSLIFQNDGSLKIETVPYGAYKGKTFFRAAMTRSLGYPRLNIKKVCKKHSKGKLRQIATSDHRFILEPIILTFGEGEDRFLVKTKDLVAVMMNHKGERLPETPAWYDAMMTKAFKKEYFGVFECDAKQGENWAIAILPSYVIRKNAYNDLPPGYNTDQGIAVLPITDDTNWFVQMHQLQKRIYDQGFEVAKAQGKTRPQPLTEEQKAKVREQFRKLKLEQERLARQNSLFD